MIGTLLRRVRGDSDDGFVLLESIIAVSLVTVVMGALAVFFTNAVGSTNHQRARATAAQLADSAVDGVRGLPASNLLTGRDQSSVTAQLAAAPAPVASWLSDMDPAYDSGARAGGGATAPIPTGPVTQRVNNINFGINSYFGWCGVATAGAATDCTLADEDTGIKYLRAVVAVTWRDSGCGSSTCAYVTATLINTADDPTFNLNQAPPPAPVATCPSSAVLYLGLAASLQLSVQQDTGVPTFTWTLTAGALPAGLTLNSAGVITGTPTALTGNLSATVTVTDSFLRQGSATCSITVLAPLKLTNPGAQASVTGTAITALQLAATGGSGPYAFSDLLHTLPAGLSMTSAGKITGTPTAAGAYPVTITVTDSALNPATATFIWTVSYPPLAASSPGNQTSTVTTAITAIQLSASGGSGVDVWTSASLPAGLALTPAGKITGTPTATGTSTVTITVTDTVTGDSKPITFTWAVLARPAVTAPGNQTTTTGATVSLTLTSSCPNTPCTYTLNNGPAGVGIDGSGLVSGTVTSTPQVFAAVSVTIKDAAGATATSGTFTWRITAPLVFASPGTRTTYQGNLDSLALAPLVSGGTAPYTFSATGLPAWLSLSGSTLSGTAPRYTSTTSITLRVTDATGASTTTSLTWVVTNLAVAISDQSNYKGTAVSVDLDTFTTGGTKAYSFAITNKPSWLTFNSSTNVLSGTAPVTTGTTTGIVVTVTDASGAVVASAPFEWRVSAIRWNTIPNQSSTTILATGTYRIGGTGTITYSATGLPAGWTINAATGLISGTTMKSNYTVTVKATDSGGDWATSAPFQWTFTTLATSITDQTSATGSVVSLNLTTLTTGGTTPYSYTATGLPSWLTLSGTTLSGTAPSTPGGTAGITITVTDKNGATLTSAPFIWHVTDFRWNTIASQTSNRLVSDSLDVTAYDNGGIAPITYTATGLPSGLTINSSTGLISGTPVTTGTYSVKVTSTDATGATVSTAAFSWKVS